MERNTGFEPATFALARQPGAIRDSSRRSQALPTLRNPSAQSGQPDAALLQPVASVSGVRKDSSTRLLPGGRPPIETAPAPMLGVREAAAWLSVSTATVYKLCRRGEL